MRLNDTPATQVAKTQNSSPWASNEELEAIVKMMEEMAALPRDGTIPKKQPRERQGSER